VEPGDACVVPPNEKPVKVGWVLLPKEKPAEA